MNKTQPLVLKGLLAVAVAVGQRDLAVAAQLVLVDHEALEADGPAGVDLVGADADLGAEAVAHAVGHARRRVPVAAGRVDGGHEALGGVGVGRQDEVRVLGRVGVNVRDGGVLVGHRLDGEVEGEELGAVVVGLDVDELGRGDGVGGGEGEGADGGLGGGVEVQGDAGREQGAGGGGKGPVGLLQGGLLDEQRLEGVAGGGVARLGVDEDVGGERGVGVGGEVGGAEAVGVAEDGDARRVLDGAHELVGAARDDEVDEVVEGQELGDDVARRDELDGLVGHTGPRRLLAALEDGGVAGLDGEGGNVGDDLGPGLENDEKDANGAGDAVEGQAVVEAGAQRETADGVFEVTHIEDALEHVLKLALAAEIQAGHETLTQGAVGGRLPGELYVFGIGLQNVFSGGGKSIVDGCEGLVAG
ncbi:hypothetical protein BN1708_004638 [Verticillium longisporum]|uniref:Uncharacterized protein n=1 Tax=Verticillium longisporum TaxID=100787 RepID=A0A0G4M2F2_VERLO|nr:hypothetical protein BN1708_004638 [Verticillium longisporum]